MAEMNCKQIDINMLQKPEALTHARQQAKNCGQQRSPQLTYCSQWRILLTANNENIAHPGTSI